jgi:hypothetical protein
LPYNNIISRADAASLIPEDVSRAMLGGLQDTSAALAAFTRIPVAQSQTRFPILSAIPTAYFVNGDTGLKQTTEVNWSNKYLNIEELACIVPIPEAVLDDAGFDVWGEVRPLVEQAIGRVFDAAVFFGTNKPASWPTDVVAAAVAAGNVVARGTNAAGAGGIYGDLSDLWGTIEADGYDPDAAIGIRTVRGRLRQARATGGESLGDEAFAREIGDLVTYPMRGLWPTGLSAAELIAFQRDQFVVGVRQDFTYKILDQAVIQDNTGAIIYNLAQQDMVAMRVTFRVGWQVANVINYDQGTEASRYPAGVLRSPAA